MTRPATASCTQPERLKELIAELGEQLPISCAMVACMLITLWTGRKPTLATSERIGHSFFRGLAEEDERPAHLAKLQKQEVEA